MEGMNGIQVLEKLKGDDLTKKIPVLILTNLGDEIIMEQAQKLGAEAYMVKADFSPTQVIAKIEKHLAAAL